MNDKGLYGIVPALITPLNEDETLDLDGLERLIEYQLEGGVHGLFIAGFTGEGAALPFEQLRSLAIYTMRFVNGRVPVCCGVLETSLGRQIESANRLSDLGIPYLSATIPFSPPAPSQDEIFRHFETLCRQTQAQWMVYGNSSMLANIRPETFHRLAQLDQIAAIKDTRPDYEGHVKNLMAVQGDPVNLLCGGEYLVGPGLLAGAVGNISGATNLFPRLFVDLYEAALRGDAPKVFSYAEDVARVHSITSSGRSCWLSAFKYALWRMGLTGKRCCSPCQEVDETQAQQIDQLLEMMK